MSEAMMRAILIASSRSLRGLRRPERIAKSGVEFAISAGADAYLHLVDENGEEWARDSRGYHAEFAERLTERWGEALDLCELMRLLSLEAGIDYHDEHRDNGSPKHGVLAKLHAKGCLIADEILTLLRHGFASGAHSRWRALHEVAVVGSFLAAGDEELAIRFLNYEHVESLAGARDYQANADAIDYEPFSVEEMEEMEQVVEDLSGKYGSLFKKRYGWAADHFGHAPSFREIEQAANLDHYRSYYRMASHPVHAGPKGILFNLGLFDDAKVMLAGPSNAGLADPGHAMCISLGQITAAFITGQTDSIRHLVTLRVLLELSDRAGEALITTHRKLERDEAAVKADSAEATYPRSDAATADELLDLPPHRRFAAAQWNG
jgi:hypothetical protein